MQPLHEKNRHLVCNGGKKVLGGPQLLVKVWEVSLEVRLDRGRDTLFRLARVVVRIRGTLQRIGARGARKEGAVNGVRQTPQQITPRLDKLRGHGDANVVRPFEKGFVLVPVDLFGERDALKRLFKPMFADERRELLEQVVGKMNVDQATFDCLRHFGKMVALLILDTRHFLKCFKKEKPRPR